MLLHDDLISQTGGTRGIRDKGLFDSAVHAPFQSFGGSDLYPSLLEKAARLGYGLIKNHPFIDGNKRIGTHAMLVFLAVNHVFLEYEDSELTETILEIASGTKNEKQLLFWLQNHIA